MKVSHNNFQGTLPQSLPSSNRGPYWCFLTEFDLSYNELEGSIPQWVANCTIYSVALSHNKFSGTLPNHWLSAYIALNNNKLNGNIPNNFWNPHVTFTSQWSSINYEFVGTWVMLSDNNLEGKIPNDLLSFQNSTIAVSVNNNKLTKIDVSDASVNINLQYIALSNNDINIDDIGSLLNNLFDTFPNLRSISLHNNQITGDISKWNTINNDNLLQAITLQNNDIYGCLSKSLHINHLQYFAVFNNHLSCQLPQHFIENTTYLELAIAIFGNLFSIDSDTSDQTEWLKNDFTDFENASSLYISIDDEIILYVYVGVIGLCIIVLFGIKIYGINTLFGYGMYSSSTKSAAQFFDQIHKILAIYTHPLILFVCCILTVIYYLYSNYMSCGRFTSHFAISYFQFTNDSTWSQVLIAILVILLFICLNLYIMERFYIFRINSNTPIAFVIEKLKKNCNKTEPSNSKPLIELEQAEESKRSSSNGDEDINTSVNSSDNSGDNSKRKIVLQVIGFGFLYFAVICVTVVYIVSENLPLDDNIWNLNYSWQIDVLKYSLSFILTLLNIYIIPKLTDSITELISYCNNCDSCGNCGSCSHARLITVYILRSLVSFIIPLIFSFLFLNDCGRYWTQLWNPCIDDEDSFDYDSTIYFSGTTYYSATVYVADTTSLVSHDDICSVQTLANINISKCLRQFFDIWIPIIALKFMIIIVNPLFMLFIKANNIDIKFKKFFSMSTCYKYCCKCCKSGCKCCSNSDSDNDSNNSNNDRKVEIDSEYAMIVTKIELSILFGFVCPALFYLCGLSIISNVIVYQLMYYKYKFKINHIDNYQFPVFILVTPILVAQIVMSVFIWNIFENLIAFAYIWICLIVVIDICFTVFGFYSQFWQRN